jgi:hypothetical protein
MALRNLQYDSQRLTDLVAKFLHPPILSVLPSPPLALAPFCG